MKTRRLVAIPLILGLGICYAADAGNGYQAPSRWDKFHPTTKPTRIAQRPETSSRSVLVPGSPSAGPITQPDPETVPTPQPSNGIRRTEQGLLVPGKPTVQPQRRVPSSNQIMQPGNPEPPNNRLPPPGNRLPPPETGLPSPDPSSPDSEFAPPAGAPPANWPPANSSPPANAPPADGPPMSAEWTDTTNTTTTTQSDALAAPWSRALQAPENNTPSQPPDDNVSMPEVLPTPPGNVGPTGKRQVMPDNPSGSYGTGVAPNGTTAQPNAGIIAPDQGMGAPGQWGPMPGSQIVIPGSELMGQPYGAAGVNGAPCGPGQGPCGPELCGAIRLPMKRWFASANLSLYSLSSKTNRRVATGMGYYTTKAVDPDSGVGIDLMAGRYLKCGLFGLGVGIMIWDPGAHRVVRNGTPGTVRADMPAYRSISIDAGSGIEPVYDIIEGTGAYGGTAGIRIDRDMRMMGLELNLFSFGLMGARRISYLTPYESTCTDNCPNPCDAPHSKGFMGYHRGKAAHGYGGATGPLVRPECGKVRVMTSHGFRWLLIDDTFEFAYNIDGTAGYQPTDIFEISEVENNLIGYQFGARLTYCINSCMHLNIGAKCGIYSNSVRFRHRIGTGIATAYRNGAPTEVIVTSSTDQGVASMCELDIGFGCRLGCASPWTVRFGYRALGVGGIATSIGSLPDHYATVASSGAVHANESLLLHAIYFGVDFNW